MADRGVRTDEKRAHSCSGECAGVIKIEKKYNSTQRPKNYFYSKRVFQRRGCRVFLKVFKWFI